MAVVLANKHEKEAVEMRAALCETLMQLAETREDIVRQGLSRPCL